MNNPTLEDIKCKKKLKWRDQNVDLHALWTINMWKTLYFYQILIIIFLKNFYNKFKFSQLKLTYNSISRQVTTPRKHNDMQSGGNEKNQEQQIKKENEIWWPRWS